MLFFLLINVKMPTIVGILTLMSRKNFMLSGVEHEKSFITSGPGLHCLPFDLHITGTGFLTCKQTDTITISSPQNFGFKKRLRSKNIGSDPKYCNRSNTIRSTTANSTGPQVIKLLSCSTQLNMEF